MISRKGLYMVWHDVDPSVEEEWNKWENEKHVPEVLEKGKFLAVRRYVVREGQGLGKYLNAYEAESPEAVKRYREGPCALREDYAERYGKTTKTTWAVLEEIAFTGKPHE